MSAGRSRSERNALVNEGIRFSGVNLCTNSLMASLKIALGLFAGSHALLANALYSINDVLSSIAVSVSLRLGAKKRSIEHPYGYGKAEFIAVGMVSLAVVLGVVFMFAFSVRDMVIGVKGAPHYTAMAVAALSVAVSWNLSKRGHLIAEKLKSPILHTATEHCQANAIGSAAAFVGIAGALAGFHSLDRIVALVEALHLVALSGGLLVRSLRGLMDTSLCDEDIDAVEAACKEISGVEQVCHIWSRRAGTETWVDVAVGVPNDASVAEAHEVTREVTRIVHHILGPTAEAQVRFQGPDLADLQPAAAGGVN